MMMVCPLCTSRQTLFYHHDTRRDYQQCQRCEMVFVPKAQRLSREAEKAVYDRHDNAPGDAGYRRFLSRLFDPLQPHLAPGARGLDFGAGPGPTLSVMFEEAGHPMAIYDPFYAPATFPLEHCYNFITASEVVEHLFEPGREFERLAGMLLPGGWLAVMTKRVTSKEAFARWHYIRDPTHVSFFSEATFVWLAKHLQLSLTLPTDDVALLHKPVLRGEETD
ncbi:class I SAM-dependent methyltransferase [Halomonas sp. TRM85114]|uniref:class I SAM-dependent methyltransferase n=1 Tax=Halomonas jincaotanensis TaxID=2810616 RepID=UPI001BD38161|nr:class I SAM-dependent methyltransferase [Halomonas jincaotanensis]MBS9404535.1 class I SAM-dependent methyltransferase [Halomonas jincaotanensis]